MAFSIPVFARVATVPTSADQRLINPAAGALRETYGFSIDVNQQEDFENVLGLTNATVEIKTKIQGANTNSVFRTGNFVWELSISPQKGSKDTANSSEGSGSGAEHNNNSSSLTLIPVQAIVSTKLSSDFSFGLKLMYTQFKFEDSTDLNVNTESYSDDIDENKNLDGTFLVAAPGFIYQLGNSGFTVAYVAELLQFKNNQAIQSTTTRGVGDGTTTPIDEITNIDTTSSDTILARKDIVGLGYAIKSSGGNNFRFEVSYEKMPPLTKVEGYPSGQMIRVIGEANFLWFRLGAEATRRTGFYVDPYNLIPYFFKIDHFGVDPVQEVSFFGGLKTSKGHGIGASYSQATSTGPQKLSVGSSEQEVETKTTKVSLSYSYFF